MRFRVTGRHDPLLLAGLAFALLVVFQPSIQQGLEFAREIEQTYGVGLLPALLILTVMFVFHQHASRRESKAEAAAAALEAAQARGRAQELEQLMLFGQALARALSTDTLRETLWRHLPALGAGAEIWVLLRSDAAWDRLTDTAGSRWPIGELEGIADRATAGPVEDLVSPDGIEVDGHVCFPMVVGTLRVGVVAIEGVKHSADLRRKIGAAATLLAIAVRNAQLFAQARDTSLTDQLTGCVNRGHGFEVLETEIARSQRSGTPLSILMFDVDHFKRINDVHGHLFGDHVLAVVGQRLRSMLRRSDIRCRYGGDEFLVILPETPPQGAVRLAEWLRGEMEQAPVEAGSASVTLSISVGVASNTGGELSPAALIERADQALYQAKAAGRNCVRNSPAPVESGFGGQTIAVASRTRPLTH